MNLYGGFLRTREGDLAVGISKERPAVNDRSIKLVLSSSAGHIHGTTSGCYRLNYWGVPSQRPLSRTVQYVPRHAGPPKYFPRLTAPLRGRLEGYQTKFDFWLKPFPSPICG